MKNHFTLILSIFILSTFFACSDDCNDPCNVECDNYDPCCGQTKADARFTVYEVLQEMPIQSLNGFDSEDAITDTIVSWNTARFRADFEAEYYEWQVGTDSRVWNTREFSLRFTSVPFYTPVEIQLKAYKPTNTSCFPDAKDTAVFTRTIVTVPRDSSLMIHRFEGYLESQPDDLTFFELKPEMTQSGREGFNVSGINSKCSINIEGTPTRYSIGYRSIFFSTQAVGVGCCLGLSGYGVIDNNTDLLTMKISTYPIAPGDSCFWEGFNPPHILDSFKEIND